MKRNQGPLSRPGTSLNQDHCFINCALTVWKSHHKAYGQSINDCHFYLFYILNFCVKFDLKKEVLQLFFYRHFGLSFCLDL